MREVDRDPGRLEDILKAADNVMSFVLGRTYESFVADKMCYFAVLKNLEIIGEASYPGSRLRDRPSRNNVANSDGRCPTIGIFS